MFGIGPWELLIVFAIVLLLFGGKRLPGIATGLGSAIRNFKEALKEPTNEDSGRSQITDDAQKSREEVHSDKTQRS